MFWPNRQPVLIEFFKQFSVNLHAGDAPRNNDSFCLKYVAASATGR
jgi:hypothetical protein